MSELKPCPFCGGDNLDTGMAPNGAYGVSCRDCRMSADFDVESDKEAQEMWNQRLHTENERLEAECAKMREALEKAYQRIFVISEMVATGETTHAIAHTGYRAVAMGAKQALKEVGDGGV